MALSTLCLHGGCRSPHSSVVQWLVEHFHVCEGSSVPRCLMYEVYRETCGQVPVSQVNPATFGKLVRIVFPDLRTRRLGTRGNARYHYDGIQIKKNSNFFARYCSLLEEKKYCSSGEVSCYEKAAKHEESIYKKETTAAVSQPKTDAVVESPSPEFSRFTSWEQELGKKHSSKMFMFLADEYYNYCQDILQNIRNRELERVEDLVTFFWKSLSYEALILMSLPDVSHLFQCYDVQLYKEIENILLHDFLEDVSIQYLKTARLFSKKFRLWLLTVLESFPSAVQIAKHKEVTLFVKRLRRKTCLANLAKTTRTVLNDIRTVCVLKSDLYTIISQGIFEIPRKKLKTNIQTVDGIESGLELKCLNSLISLLGTSSDLRVFLNCVSSLLQAFVFQPSKNKDEFKKLAANFQLRWNFLLTSVSKAMTLFHADSFGSWHLLNVLLLEYAIHILQTCIEEEENGKPLETLQRDHPPIQIVQESTYLLEVFAGQPKVEGAPQVTIENSKSELNINNILLKVLGFSVDAATGNKLIQVALEDKVTKSTVKLNLPVGQEAVVTLKDGQKFVIHTSDVIQDVSSTSCSGETKANLHEQLA
ncbi:DNA-binding protein RFX8 isoform X1 [Ambystoma mexicanum]|uniref:DNA-binding protein RFX8 isoform X1 n=1 Tax=Ambystoma mexicanum TaxID=8296 RepID=UPI0037E8F8C1